jgi:hypothetical protein
MSCFSTKGTRLVALFKNADPSNPDTRTLIAQAAEVANEMKAFVVTYGVTPGFVHISLVICVD